MMHTLFFCREYYMHTSSRLATTHITTCMTASFFFFNEAEEGGRRPGNGREGREGGGNGGPGADSTWEWREGAARRAGGWTRRRHWSGSSLRSSSSSRVRARPSSVDIVPSKPNTT